MRPIDADEVLEQIRKKLGIKSLSYLLEAERQIVDVIQSAPSIDIVRCKECKWCEDCDGLMCQNPNGWVVATEEDFGCILGERKETDHE